MNHRHTPVPATPDTVQPQSSERSGSERRPYQTPAVQLLGGWTALTLVTSLPIGPGGMVFGDKTTV